MNSKKYILGVLLVAVVASVLLSGCVRQSGGTSSSTTASDIGIAVSDFDISDASVASSSDLPIPDDLGP